MNLKLVIPRDPLIFRDGRPFTAVPGERSKSLLFPFPATLAGAVRTRDGTNSGKVDFATKRVEALKKLQVRGPILVELEADGKIKQWYFPAPADALFIEKDKNINLYALSPLDTKGRDSNIQDNLALVGAKKIIKDKPMNKAPLYWNWSMFKEWLKNPGDKESIKPADYGIQGLTSETRTHVSIEASTQSALSGALFQTSGMEFIKKNKGETLGQVGQLALALETDAKFDNGVDFLGGERRVIRWENVDGNLDTLLPHPAEIENSKHCRLILATPAYFEEGYIPNKYKKYIKAVALPRYQTISGWDYDIKKSKPTRRLVPAGTMYFLKDLENMQKFVEDVWLKSICDDEQARNDGFGLALIGAWDGELHTLEVK